MLQQQNQLPNRHYLPHQQEQRYHTSVQIQPSKSYEIKDTTSGYETYNNNPPNQQISQNHYSNNEPTDAYQYDTGKGAPVIVLRIPGSPKYAAHLQALLQQYLEVRAYQFIKLLQEQEQRNQINYHNSNNNNYHQQYEYVQSQSVAHTPQYQDVVYPNNRDYSQQQDDTYRSDKAQPIYQNDDEDYHQQYTEQQQQQQTYESIDEHPGYVYAKAEPAHDTESSKENYPSPDHTQVYYPNSDNYQYEQNEYHQDHSDQEYAGQAISLGTKNFVAITQKTPAAAAATTPPYNYHAHPTTMQSIKRQVVNNEDQYKKFSLLANRLREKSEVMKRLSKPIHVE